MIKKIKGSMRTKFTLIFIGILCFACTISFAIVSLFSLNSSKYENIINLAGQDLKQIVILLLVTCTLCAIIGSVLMYFATKMISKPIKYVSDTIREVSKGDFEVVVNYESEDEIGALANNFNLMTRELKSMEYLRKDFMSNVSHEFKTPIASIQGFAEMLKDKNLPSYKRDEYIEIIVEETERLSHLSSNMLRISRLDNQTIPNKVKEFSLDEQIRKVILLLESKWDKKNLQLDIELEKVIYNGDEDLIQQIWINLIENAIKFSPDEGILSVKLQKIDNKIVAEVSDNGIGMSEECKKRIFEQFYQGDTSHKKEGNGLGLAIIKRIVEICNGEVQVESKIGEGTTFKIFLPKNVDN